MISIRLIGAKKTKRWLEKKPQKVKSETYQAMDMIGEVLIGETKKRLSMSPAQSDIKKGVGRVEDLVLPKNPSAHLRVVSDRLRGGISKLLQHRGKMLHLFVGTNVKYGRVHEEGLTVRLWGKIPYKMRKRPFLAPALKKSLKKIEKIYGKALDIALR